MLAMPFEPDLTSIAQTLGATLLLKAGVVMGVAGLTTVVLKRASAASRSAVWSAAFAVLISLPLVALVLPSWHPLSLPQLGAPASVNVPVEGDLSVTAIGLVEPSGIQSATLVPAGAPPLRSTLVFGLVALWLAVAVALLARVATHYLIALRLYRSGRPVSPSLNALGRRCAQTVGLRKVPRIISSAQVQLPASFGWPRPTIILPAQVGGWGHARVTAVLTHEMAHLSRRDHVVQLLVEVTRAWYWVNPLVHVAAARIAVERERSCDDVALRSGHSPSGYARILVDLARSVVRPGNTAASLAVAGRSGLAERVRNILDEKNNRAPTRGLFVGAASLVAAVVLIPVAALDLISQDQMSVPQLVEQLRSADTRVARRAAWALGEREDPTAAAALIEQLRHGEPDVRLVSAWALGELKDPLATEALIQNLEDDDPAVREMAALALGELEQPGVVGALVTAGDRDDTIRGAIAWALGEIDSEEAWRARSRLGDGYLDVDMENDEVWSGTLAQLASVSLDGTVSDLLVQLQSSSSNDRLAAAWNLGLLGSVAAVDGLLDALRDPTPAVRAMVVWALDEINPSRI